MGRADWQQQRTKTVGCKLKKRRVMARWQPGYKASSPVPIVYMPARGGESQTGHRLPGWRPARGARGVGTGGSRAAAAPHLVPQAPSGPQQRARGADGRGARRPRRGRRLGRARRGRRAARALARIPQALLTDGQLHLGRGVHIIWLSAARPRAANLRPVLCLDAVALAHAGRLDYPLVQDLPAECATGHDGLLAPHMRARLHRMPCMAPVLRRMRCALGATQARAHAQDAHRSPRKQARAPAQPACMRGAT